jgi:hypothetical protein
LREDGCDFKTAWDGYSNADDLFATMLESMEQKTMNMEIHLKISTREFDVRILKHWIVTFFSNSQGVNVLTHTQFGVRTAQ